MPERVSTDHCLKAGIAGAKEFARISGFTLDLSPDRLIDDQHLHCVFYGGDIGSIKLPNGWSIVISANGDIDLTAELEDGTEISYENKRNDGAKDSDFLEKIKNDQHLKELDDAGAIDWVNNNWLEVNYIDPKGRFVDLSITSDNILQNDNVLEAFYHDSIVELMDELDKFIQHYDIDTGIYHADT